MKTEKSDKGGATTAAAKTLNNVETKNGAEKGAQTLTSAKGEEKPIEKTEPVAAPVSTAEAKPSAEQILKRLLFLNNLQDRLRTLDERNDQLMSANTRKTGQGETITIKFLQGEAIIITNAVGINKCLDLLIDENEKLIEKTKTEIENFKF